MIQQEYRKLDNFWDWKAFLEENDSKIGVLVLAFKTLHPHAPADDLKVVGDRMAGMVKQARGDYAYILLKIWQTSTNTPVGSHLNYINATLKNGTPTQGKPKVGVDKNNPDRYTKGGYSQFVVR